MTGTDWEWWIGNNRVGWLRYAVQAKKIGKSHRYETLNHTVHKGKKQVSILKEYSEANQAIPLYCFYNYVDVLEIKPNSDFKNYWKCNFSYEKEQIGCTITPLKNVEQALRLRGKRTFEFLHSCSETKPWRCLIKCPLFYKLYDPTTENRNSILAANFGFENVHLHRELPDVFFRAFETGILEEFPSQFYNQELEIYPRAISF